MSSTTGAPPPGVGQAPQLDTSQVDGLNAQIKGFQVDISNLIAEVQMLSEECKSLRDQIKDQQGRKPTNPGSDASDEAKADYKNAMDAWRGDMDSLQGQLQGLCDNISKCQQKITELGSKIKRCEGQIPVEQQRAQQKLDDEVRLLEEAAKEAAKALEQSVDKGDSTAIKLQVVKKAYVSKAGDVREGFAMQVLQQAPSQKSQLPGSNGAVPPPGGGGLPGVGEPGGAS